MAINSNDRKDLSKDAKEEGYRKSSDGKSLIKDDGSKITFSQSGGSVDVNGTVYTSASDVRNGERM